MSNRISAGNAAAAVRAHRCTFEIQIVLGIASRTDVQLHRHWLARVTKLLQEFGDPLEIGDLNLILHIPVWRENMQMIVILTRLQRSDPSVELL